MALAQTLWTTIVDLVSTGQNVSDNLDTAFTNIDTAITQIDTNVTDIAALDVRLTAEESKLDDALSIVTTSPLAAQTLVAGVAEKLEWMTTAIVDTGTAISHTIATDDILINEAATYEVFGVVTLVAPINDTVDIELYIDNLPTGFVSSMIGRGSGSRISFAYSFMTPFSINDDINLYVKSTGTTVTLQSASVTVKKTNY